MPDHFRLRNGQKAEIGHTNHIVPTKGIFKAHSDTIIWTYERHMKSNQNIIKPS